MKVKIAPTEKWCQSQLEHLARNPLCALLPGLEIELVPEMLCVHDNARHWEMARESYLKLFKITGEGDPSLFRTASICEHILEVGD